MKKFLLMITMFLCITSTVFASDYIFNGETLPATSGYDDMYYGVETVKNILDDLNVSYTDSTLLSYTYYINRAFISYNNNQYSITPLNVVFAVNDGGLAMYFSNGTFSSELPYLCIGNQSTTYGGRRTVYWFSAWKKDASSGAITGVTTSTPSYMGITSSNFTLKNGTQYFLTSSQIQNGSVIEFDKNILFPISSFSYASHTADTGYSWYFGAPLIRFTEEPDVEISSGDTGGGDTGGGDTGGGTGGGTGSTDLTMTNAKIDQLNEHAEEILNKMPTSGDIEEATQNGVVQGSTDFWGSSGDVSGDEQEVLIENELNNFIGTMSGDIAENEIFGILQTYEDKLFGGFTGEEDFKIEWQDISYMDNVIIPAGSVNFSEICRENEALGNVKFTINIILTFIILMNIVTYMYNLLLATLGIDNPYLYEKPVGSVTVAEYTDEKGNTYTTTTQHDGRGNSIGRRYQNSTGASSSSRKIGFDVPQYKRWWR